MDGEEGSIGYGDHKVLHGALGAFCGALTNIDDPLHGAASGAVGAFIAETVGEAVANHKLLSVANEYVNECGHEGRQPTREGYEEYLIKSLRGAGEVGKLSGAVGALFTHLDPTIAFRTGSNAIDNNLLNFALYGAITVGMVAWTAYEINEIYKTEGPEAALKQLGIEMGVAVIGGVVVKGAFKVGKIAYRTSAEAVAAAVDAKPGLRLALGGLTQLLSKYTTVVAESAVGRGVAAVGGKIASASAKVDAAPSPRCGCRKRWNHRKRVEMGSGHPAARPAVGRSLGKTVATGGPIAQKFQDF